MNGETGTVSAGNYAKGDSVSLYVTAMPEGESGSKKFYTTPSSRRSPRRAPKSRRERACELMPAVLSAG